MNYQGKIVGLTGADGFLGSALAKGLRDQGAIVKVISGDIRDPETFNRVVDYTMDYLFHFAAPSSQILFKRQSLYSADVTLNGFINAAMICKQNGVKLIYPSTGLLSQGDTNEYARCKKLCEDIHLGENVDAIGIRVFATYGPSEGHKRDYASVPYLFIRDMVNGKRPIIYGDGRQVRDFIYIDDTVEGILRIAEEATEPIIDLGFGKQTSFIRLIRIANEHLNMAIEPIFVDKPVDYVEKTSADLSIMKRYYQPLIGIDEGIGRIVANEKSHRNNHNK